MKLYECPRNCKVKVLDEDPRTPLGAPNLMTGDIIDFDHIDGMYSFCINKDGQIVHLAAWAEVEIVEG